MNSFYFVETAAGASEPKALCERHAQQQARRSAISEPLEETEVPCELCRDENKEALLEIATDIIGTEGEGMLEFFGLLGGLLEARAEANDENAHVFHTTGDGVARILDSLLEIEFDKFNEGDPVIFTAEVRRTNLVLPVGTKGTITRISAACVVIKFERAGILDNTAANTVLFDRAEVKFKETFLHTVRKL